MTYVGDYALGATFYFNFETLYNNTLTSLAGSPSLAVYADNNVVQFSTGLTLTADFDSVVGTHNVQVVATSGNGFATGTNYCVRLAAGTVGGLTAVGRIVGEFSIEKVSALRPATAGRTLVVDLAGLGDSNVVKLGPSGAGTAQTARDVGASVIAASVTAAVSVTGDLSATMKTSITTAALATQMTESYAADGVAPTLAQLLFLLLAAQTEFAVSGTTMTAKKLDGATTAATFTLDSATTPTSITRSS